MPVRQFSGSGEFLSDKPEMKKNNTSSSEIENSLQDCFIDSICDKLNVPITLIGQYVRSSKEVQSLITCNLLSHKFKLCWLSLLSSLCKLSVNSSIVQENNSLIKQKSNYVLTNYYPSSSAPGYLAPTISLLKNITKQQFKQINEICNQLEELFEDLLKVKDSLLHYADLNSSLASELLDSDEFERVDNRRKEIIKQKSILSEIEKTCSERLSFILNGQLMSSGETPVDNNYNRLMISWNEIEAKFDKQFSSSVPINSKEVTFNENNNINNNNTKLITVSSSTTALNNNFNNNSNYNNNRIIKERLRDENSNDSYEEEELNISNSPFRESNNTTNFKTMTTTTTSKLSQERAVPSSMSPTLGSFKIPASPIVHPLSSEEELEHEEEESNIIPSPPSFISSSSSSSLNSNNKRNNIHSGSTYLNNNNTNDLIPSSNSNNTKKQKTSQ
ncbi:hypothetical protein ABK040_007235 [Willaertia magna]